MEKLKLVFDRDLLSDGIRHYISIDMEKNHHWILAGPTGSGKTSLLLLLMGKLSRIAPTGKVYILDFKGSDELRFLKNIPFARYYSHLDCTNGLKVINDEFEARLQGSQDRTPIFVCFDEYGPYINYLTVLDKKSAEAQRIILSNLLFLSRTLNFFCILSTQRPDSGLFQSGAREQCTGAIGLGALSLESRKMLFGEYDTDLIEPCGTGCGYLAMQGFSKIRPITVPNISKMDKLEKAIAAAVTR